jgi:hypothetical protein
MLTSHSQQQQQQQASLLMGDSVNSKNPKFGNPKFRTTHIFLGKFRDRVRALFLNFRRTSKFRISKFRLFRIYGVTH